MKRFRFAVFGLGSTMYSGFEEALFNKAAKQLDRNLLELGGNQLVPVGLGNDMGINHYHEELEKWLSMRAPRLQRELEESNDFQDVKEVFQSAHSEVVRPMEVFT